MESVRSCSSKNLKCEQLEIGNFLKNDLPDAVGATKFFAFGRIHIIPRGRLYSVHHVGSRKL